MFLKTLRTGAFLCLVATSAAQAQTINFGDNTSEYANDGECDDRRFRGVGMATGLDVDDSFHDANDCKTAFGDGRIKLWIAAEAKAATQCTAYRYGDNSSEWANDGECDDFRFEGKGMSSVILSEDIGHDAEDCRKLCQSGKIFIREY